MRAISVIPRSLALATLSLGVCLSFGCSSSSSSSDGAAGAGGASGRDGAAGAGGASGRDGAAGGDAAGGVDGGSDLAPTDSAPDAIVEMDAAALGDVSPEVTPADGPETLTLGSSSLAQGAAFLAVNTCAGANTSPPFTWTAGPAGTQSYAVSLTDLTINAVHWVIWDLPATTTSLPAALPGDTALASPPGAKQIHKVEFFGAGGAYRGPCPSGKNHVYQFEVNAIGAATLAGVGATPTAEGVKAAVQAASLAHGNLEGTSNATAAP
jgi:Raf kinase inhibitor-like YbhB/YbcL family protein